MHGTNGLRTETQFSVFLVNKPGVLSRVVHALTNTNIIAMSMMDSTDHGVLRVVADKPERVREAVEGLDLTLTESPVLCATLPNRPGALADVVERLADARIEVNYAYCTTGARGGKTTGVFKVGNAQKAVQVLSERKPKRVTAKKPRTGKRVSRR